MCSQNLASETTMEMTPEIAMPNDIDQTEEREGGRKREKEREREDEEEHCM